MNGSSKDKHPTGSHPTGGQSSGKGSVDLTELSSILELLSLNDVTEFELNKGELHLSLKRGRDYPQPAAATSGSHQIIPFPYPNYQTQGFTGSANPAPQLAAPQVGAAAASTAEPATSAAKAIVELTPSKQLREITSPIVGTFYRRPAVDAEPYVDVGDVVKKGDVLCIVEAMKLMNEIEADVGGKIVEICIQDGSMVEYGEALFRIEPV